METPKRVTSWGGEEGERREVRVVGVSAREYHAGVVVVGGEDRRVKKSCKKTVEVGEGVFLLHDPVEVAVDVVFIGEDLGVWRGGKEADEGLWPRDWLSEDIKVVYFRFDITIHQFYLTIILHLFNRMPESSQLSSTTLPRPGKTTKNPLKILLFLFSLFFLPLLSPSGKTTDLLCS